jgi:phosphoribosylformylglycinamidine (FGAM) synthase-like enzyme
MAPLFFRGTERVFAGIRGADSDPITQKRMTTFCPARDKVLYNFITDNGAGGLSSSIGEMSSECGGAVSTG